jgi:hypothetical protein
MTVPVLETARLAVAPPARSLSALPMVIVLFVSRLAVPAPTVMTPFQRVIPSALKMLPLLRLSGWSQVVPLISNVAPEETLIGLDDPPSVFGPAKSVPWETLTVPVKLLDVLLRTSLPGMVLVSPTKLCRRVLTVPVFPVLTPMFPGENNWRLLASGTPVRM